MKSKFTGKILNYQRGILAVVILKEVFGEDFNNMLDMHWRRKVTFK